MDEANFKTTGNNELISVTQAAKLLKISKQTIRKNIKEGHLPAVTFGSNPAAPRYRIRMADLQKIFTRVQARSTEDEVVPGQEPPANPNVRLVD